ncbi:MAG: hypothetical protein R2810_08960 [Flavobacteriales bacterium]
MEIQTLKYLVLLPAVILYLRLPAARPPWSWWTGGLLLAGMAVEGLGFWLASQGWSNLLYFNGYMVLEFALILGVQNSMTAARKGRVYRVSVAATIFLAALLQEGLGTDLRSGFLTRTLVVGGLLLAVSGVDVLFRMARRSDSPLAGRADFWMLVSVVTYFLCFIPTMGLYHYVGEKDIVLAEAIYGINDYLFILRYGLLAYSLHLLGRNLKRHGRDLQ